MSPLDELVAAEAIRGTKARYFRCVDTKDWAGLATVFTTDVVLDRTYGGAVQDPWSRAWTPPLPPEPVRVHGRDAVLAAIRNAVEPLHTVHQGFMPEIAFTGDDTAQAIWAMSDELRDRQGRLIVAGRGHYHDLYRRTADGWRIAEFRLTRLSLVTGDGRRDA